MSKSHETEENKNTTEIHTKNLIDKKKRLTHTHTYTHTHMHTRRHIHKQT